MNDCYNRNNKNYDWLIFYELDEFIHLSNFTNVKPFLNEKKFEKCEIVYEDIIFSWLSFIKKFHSILNLFCIYKLIMKYLYNLFKFDSS